MNFYENVVVIVFCIVIIICIVIFIVGLLSTCIDDMHKYINSLNPKTHCERLIKISTQGEMYSDEATS